MKDSGTLFDSNVWVALVFPSHPLHDQASKALATASVRKPALFCRSTELSFLRLITTPTLQRAYGSPRFSNREALVCLKALGEMPQVSAIEEAGEIRDLWMELAALPTASPKVWMDALLAATAIVSKVALTTGDRDFVPFEKAGLSLRLLGG